MKKRNSINYNNSFITCYIVFIFTLLTSSNCWAYNPSEIDRYKATFNKFPNHAPTNKTVDDPLAGNGDIGLTMVPSSGRIVFYVGKNDFWKAVESKPEGRIALPGGLTITSDFFKKRVIMLNSCQGVLNLKPFLKKGEDNLL